MNKIETSVELYNMVDCRARIQLKRPNPLFERWVEELYLDAVSRESKSRHQLAVALDSLKKYPLVLKTGSECVILKGFGKNLCKILDRKLARHGHIKTSDNTNMHTKRKSANVNILKTKSPKTYVPSHRSGAYAILVALLNKSQEASYKGFMTKSELIAESQIHSDHSMTKKRPGTFYTAWSNMTSLINKSLVVKHNNKGYSLSEGGSELAIKLLANSINNENILADLKTVTESVSFCDNEQTEAEEEQIIHSQFRSNNETKANKKTIKEVIQIDTKISCNVNNLIEMEDPQLIQTLFESTKKIRAQKKYITETNRNNPKFVNEVIDIGLPQTIQQNIKAKVPLAELHIPVANDQDNVEDLYDAKIFTPNNFEVILLVDKQESCGSRKDDTMKQKMAKFTMIKHEMRHLKVGDFAWVARNSAGDEVILPYIVERKRMDDFGHSIKDGRFHEQKFRLKQCGIPNIIYLIESYGNNQQSGLPLQSLMQAAANTRIQNGFLTHFTASQSDSLKFLAMMTTMLLDNFKTKTLTSCRKINLSNYEKDSNKVNLMLFSDFNIMASKSKTLTVAEMFTKQLLQLKGMTVHKATAIVSEYQTPRNLISAFQDRSTNKPELLLTNMLTGSSKCKISPLLSNIIYNYYTSQKLL